MYSLVDRSAQELSEEIIPNASIDDETVLVNNNHLRSNNQIADLAEKVSSAFIGGLVMENVNKQQLTQTTGILDATGHFVKKHKTAFSCIGGAIAIAPIAFVAAPAIATAAGMAGLLGTTATTGATISMLWGCALTNASLAAIGNGALIIGGSGMVGGTTVITGAGAAVGAATGVGVKSAVISISKRFKKNA